MLPDTAFKSMVWKIARLVPKGKEATYGQIAALIPAPEGAAPEEYQAARARWAGQAMAECPPDVPWQRVINAQGMISPRRRRTAPPVGDGRCSLRRARAHRP